MHDYTNSCKDSCPGTWKVTQCRKTDDLTVCANKTNPLFRQQMKQYNYIKCNYGTRGRTLGGCLGGCETPPALQNRKKSVHISVQNCEKSRFHKPVSSHDDVFYIFHYFSILFGRTKITIIFEEKNSSIFLGLTV